MPVPTCTSSAAPTDITTNPHPSSTTTASDAASSGTNIWVAAGEGDLQRVKYWIEERGLAPDAADPHGYTPIHAAASWAREDVLRYLLTPRSGASSSGEESGSGRGGGKLSDTKDPDGETALFVTEQVSIAKILIEEFGADPKIVNEEGVTALDMALENDNEEVAEYLSQVTGVPIPEDEEEGGNDDAQANQPGQAQAEGTADDQAISRRADELMDRVEQIMRRAQLRQESETATTEGSGQSGGIILNQQEENEIRQVVGASVMRQLVEGWERGAGAGAGASESRSTSDEEPEGEEDANGNEPADRHQAER